MANQHDRETDLRIPKINAKETKIVKNGNNKHQVTFIFESVEALKIMEAMYMNFNSFEIFTVSGDSCKDTEFWCKFEPNCEKQDVQEKCPKFCKICKGI